MPKVMWVMSYSFVANFIRFPAVQKIETRLRFDKVTESLNVGTFWDTVLYNACRYGHFSFYCILSKLYSMPFCTNIFIQNSRHVNCCISTYSQILSSLMQRLLQAECVYRPLTDCMDLFSAEKSEAAVDADETAAAAAALSAHLAGGDGLSDSQRELVGIMEQVKHKHLTVQDAENCFYDWKMRHESGCSRSFKQKKVSSVQLPSWFTSPLFTTLFTLIKSYQWIYM